MVRLGKAGCRPRDCTPTARTGGQIMVRCSSLELQKKKESSEVVWGPFFSASSSLLTLARPLSLLPLRAQRAI